MVVNDAVAVVADFGVCLTLVISTHVRLIWCYMDRYAYNGTAGFLIRDVVAKSDGQNNGVSSGGLHRVL